ncbi:MAG: aminopeptidase N, partial [Rhodocyclaceae bacterium]|nr:aminopeptidase N [Rhodocyclaceae bacterium]
MKTDTAPTIRLADYTPPPFLVDSVTLDVDFRPNGVLVTATQTLRRNPAAPADAPLVLDGLELETLAVKINHTFLTAADYELTDTQLTLRGLPDACELQTQVRIHPDANTRLSGLYRSANGYFTQCEAQGFRAITWFQDRPDVMARFTVKIHADKEAFPLLLSNGNPVASG